jgi:alkanesulfonate monooxygenase SsuD/methylene tetrahydromethanopterin reductase-like flavin-dependent oxidoreductase (luciferase family)
VKVDLFCMPTIPTTTEERERLRPVGRNPDKYHEMIDQLRELAIFADELGIDGFSATEHHLHTEGGEALPNQLIMFTDLAARTKNIYLIPMSIVLTAANPLRAAEDVALLDHLSGGRTAVCFARGYQKRWTQTLTQGGPPLAEGQTVDQQSRELFDEYLEIVVKAWTEESFKYDGKYFKVPYPYEGIEGWKPVEWTRKFGAHREIDENGLIREIGVVPAPLQKPHPEIFVPFTASPSTLQNAAIKGYVPFTYASVPEEFRKWTLEYQRLAQENGRNLQLGQKFGAVRAVSLGDTYEEAFELAVKTTGHIKRDYFALFGLADIFRRPTDDPNKPVTFKDDVDATQRNIDGKWLLCGTVDDVKRELEALHGCHGGDGELEWFQWTFYQQGNISIDAQKRQLEMFATKVLPEFN